MRLVFTSDFHGHAALYQQLEELLLSDRPDAVILGGDMFPDGDLDDPAGTQGRYVQEIFVRRIERWRGLLPDMAVACILGNHDWRCSEHALHTYHEQSLIALLDHRWPWTHRGVSFLGYGCTPPTPYWVKDFERLDLPDDPLPETGGAVWETRSLSVRQVSPQDHFGKRPAMATDFLTAVRPAGPWVFVCHAPPFDSKLDRLPHLDYPIGSKAVRGFLAERRPLCALHGHIHESPLVTGSFAVDVEGVLSINPGQSHQKLHAITLDTDDPRASLKHTVF